MRNSLRVVFLSLALAANAALAQQSILVSVPGWPQVSNRADGKFAANAFTWAVTAQPVANVGAGTGSGMGSGKPSPQDSVLLLPVGDASVLFTKAAFRGERLSAVLVEFSLAKAVPNAAAPFAMRLSDVLVTSVVVSKSGSDGGTGAAEVKLKAGRVELFTSNQTPSGAMQPGQRTGMDFNVMKAM